MQPLEFRFPKEFTGKLSLTVEEWRTQTDRNQGCCHSREGFSKCERETAYALYLAGFDVRDVHMTDLASRSWTLDDVNFIVFCGGFSNSDVLGSR